MRSGIVPPGKLGVFMVAAVMLLAAPAAQAQGTASVRFVHAVPGVDRLVVSLQAGGRARQLGREAAFGEVTPYAPAPPGSVRLQVRSGGRTVGSATTRLERGGLYTAVAVTTGRDAGIRFYRDAPAAPRIGRVRVIHASPELGTPELRLGGRVIAARFRPGSATRYLRLEPGAYELRATRPGGRGDPVVGPTPVQATAGTATTVFAIGSRGEPTRFVVASDASVAPVSAPATGLGGLAGDEGVPWRLALLLALAAGALGGAGYSLAARLGRRRGGGAA